MALQYGSSTSVGVGTVLNSLASSTTAVAQTDLVTTSTTSNITDALVRVNIAVGAITPSTSTLVNIFAFGSEDGTVMAGAASGTVEVLGSSAAAITLSANGNNLRFLGSIVCHTASITMRSQPLSVAAAFGGVMPRKYGLVIQNQTGAAFAASGHSVSYTEAYYT